MPVKSCSKNGKSGYKWGDSGNCYTGPGAKKKALKQGVAIEKNKQKKGEKSEFDKGNIIFRKGEVFYELDLIDKVNLTV